MMKIKSIFPLLFLSLVLITGISSHTPDQGKVLRHVVMFKFSEKATSASIQKIEKSFAALPQKIKEIKGFEWGTNSSPEKMNQGLTHCFILTFTSDKDRNAYLVHPAHQDFGKSLGSDVEKVTVLDFWVK